MKKILWTKDMLAILKAEYPKSTNLRVAEILNISVLSVIRKAKELNISKTKDDSREWKAMVILENFNDCSYSELAEMTGLSRSGVRTIASLLGLKRDKATETYLRSKARQTLLKREMIRRKLGLRPVSKLKSRCCSI